MSKEDTKKMIDRIVEKVNRLIIRGDIDVALKEIGECYDQAKSVFGESAIELLPTLVTMALAQVCKGGSKSKKGEKLLIIAYCNLMKQTSDENKNSATEQSLVSS